MKLSEKALRQIIIEEFSTYLAETCRVVNVDRTIKHSGTGKNKRSYIQIKTTKNCEDNIYTPEEAEAAQAEREKEREAIKKRQRSKANQRVKKKETKSESSRQD